MKEPTTKQLIERWENVLRVLRALTPHQRKKHWDMGEWGLKTECGTVACAAGHCGLDPWFKKHGFASMWRDKQWAGFTVEAREFFGDEGYWRIFLRTGLTTVPAVIREVRAHIKKLKAA